MRISRLAVSVVVLVASATPRAAGGQSATATAPETVVVSSGALRLTALLWKPEGRGSFPAILFNHGSGNRVNDALALKRAHLLGPVFAKHGYVFLYLFRRGYGLSVGQGESQRDVLERELKARGEEARRRMQMVLLTTDHLDDVKAGLSFLKRVAGVDTSRIALAGHSFGGQLALLAAERNQTIRAVVTFAAAADSWEGVGTELQERMLSAVRNISVPVFLSHAANDYSIVPGQRMAAEFAGLKRAYELKIYPAVGKTAADGHDAVHTDVATWEADVFRFLNEHTR